ncbi:MAG: hypothetical protein ACI9LO_000422 [Planctomycetota bacterium]|jgi:hypothetical protein
MKAGHFKLPITENGNRYTTKGSEMVLRLVSSGLSAKPVFALSSELL